MFFFSQVGVLPCELAMCSSREMLELLALSPPKEDGYPLGIGYPQRRMATPLGSSYFNMVG